jgi:anti-sigma B factor antagonist
MYIHTEEHKGVSVIIPDKNKLLGIEAAEIQNTLLDLIEKGNRTIAVDLSGVDYLTSWGIGILIHASVTCTNRDISFFLFGVNEKVMNILRKVKLDTVLDIRETV